MRKHSVIAFALLCLHATSCGGKSVEAPAPDSHLQVFVHWEDQALEGRKLEILELGIVGTTDADGTAEFTLPSGTFTLRAHVNGGGPIGIQDVSVTTRSGETTRVEVVDCLPCVGAT